MNWNLVQFDYAAILIVYCLIHFKCGIVLICARIIIISRNSRLYEKYFARKHQNKLRPIDNNFFFAYEPVNWSTTNKFFTIYDKWLFFNTSFELVIQLSSFIWLPMLASFKYRILYLIYAVDDWNIAKAFLLSEVKATLKWLFDQRLIKQSRNKANSHKREQIKN